ncbi:MAG TPA: hypothetical protein VKK61_03360 [Tepidisphaeraceae bacterium]|nr:hypothetical protein [Tepidisphaeraceae bacterium]
MQRLRRRHTYLLILILVLLSLSRGVVLRRAQADDISIDASPKAQAVAVNAYPTPSWKISNDDFWELIQPFFSKHETQTNEPFANDDKKWVPLAPGSFIPAAPAPVIATDITRHLDVEPAPILFWPEHSPATSGTTPFPSFEPIFIVRNSQENSVSSNPPIQPPNLPIQFSPAPLPEPNISVLIVLALLPRSIWRKA